MTSTFDRVRDELGSAVVTGVLPVGHRDSIDGFVVRTGASRSIVREAVRVLVGCGLLSAQRRTGLVVQPPDRWDVTDPLVLGWQLAGPDRPRVLAELLALRRAVEPAAAAAAATAVAAARPLQGAEPDPQGAAADARGAATDARPAASGPQADRRLPDPLAELLASATVLADWTDGDDAATFLQADRQLHRSLLALSGNALFVRLGRATARALDERASVRPALHDVGLHVRLAREVAAGDACAARSTMTEIIDRTVA